MKGHFQQNSFQRPYCEHVNIKTRSYVRRAKEGGPNVYIKPYQNLRTYFNKIL